MPLLEVCNLQTQFRTREGIYKAVRSAEFRVEAGQTLAVVGESGSGKSVSMLSILGLIPQPPGKIISGTAMFENKDLLQIPKSELRKIRGNKISMIFQDPMTCLNPYLSIETQLTEVLFAHQKASSKKEARHKAIEALEHVGIPDATKRIQDYPHQFSGGMRQRVMIAMALITRPQLLIADEPTTALDVTIQAQILKLLRDLQKEIGLAIVLITHDLGVVAGMADQVNVMYAGQVIEQASADELFYRSAHPYTLGLLNSSPRVDQPQKELLAIPGLPPDPSKLPAGCAFASRCPKVMNVCRQDQDLPLRKYENSHKSLCYWERKHA